MENRVLAISECIRPDMYVAVRLRGVFRYDLRNFSREHMHCAVSIASVAEFSKNCMVLFTAGPGYVRMENVKPPRKYWHRPVNMFDAVAIGVSGDASRVIVGATDGAVFVLDSKEGKILHALNIVVPRMRAEMPRMPTAVGLNHNGTLAFATSVAHGVIRLELGSSVAVVYQDPSGEATQATALHVRSGDILISGEANGMIHLSDSDGDMWRYGSFHADLARGQNTPITCIAHKGPLHILVGMANGRTLLYSIATFTDHNGGARQIRQKQECSVHEDLDLPMPVSKVAFCCAVGDFAVACGDTFTIYHLGKKMIRDSFTPVPAPNFIAWLLRSIFH